MRIILIYFPDDVNTKNLGGCVAAHNGLGEYICGRIRQAAIAFTAAA